MDPPVVTAKSVPLPVPSGIRRLADWVFIAADWGKDVAGMRTPDTGIRRMERCLIICALFIKSVPVHVGGKKNTGTAHLSSRLAPTFEAASAHQTSGAFTVRVAIEAVDFPINPGWGICREDWVILNDKLVGHLPEGGEGAVTLNWTNEVTHMTSLSLYSICGFRLAQGSMSIHSAPTMAEQITWLYLTLLIFTPKKRH